VVCYKIGGCRKCIKMAKCIIPGTFNPVTLGHCDIIGRCARIFDEVHVVAFQNIEKPEWPFTMQERVQLILKSVAGMPNVVANCSQRLVSDYAKELGITTLVKGLRNVRDFEYEADLEWAYKTIDSDLEVLYLRSSPLYMQLSSSVVREFAKYQLDLSQLVPAAIINEVTTRLGLDKK